VGGYTRSLTQPQKQQEAQLSPRHPRDALYQLKYCPTVVQITHTDPRVSLRSNFSNCHVLFGYLHSFVRASLQYAQISHSEHAVPCVSSTDFHTTNQPWRCQLHRNCDHQTSTTTKFVNVFLRQRPVVDADDRGGWTQILGGKASEPETFQPIEKRTFY